VLGSFGLPPPDRRLPMVARHLSIPFELGSGTFVIGMSCSRWPTLIAGRLRGIELDRTPPCCSHHPERLFLY
jgi:hypothetical protein